MTDNELDRVIDAMAALLGLTIPDADRAQVRFNFALASRMAEQVAALPLDEREEPLPVYRP